MTYRKIIGENVRKLRNERKWTQEKLAALSKVDQGYIGTLERGLVNVSIDTMEKLAKALKVKPIEFLKE
jgi:XRE family transcriptional regulator, regulator of sulfur utilization